MRNRVNRLLAMEVEEVFASRKWRTYGEAQQALNIAQSTLSRLLNGSPGVKVETVLRFAKAIGEDEAKWRLIAAGLTPEGKDADQEIEELNALINKEAPGLLSSMPTDHGARSLVSPHGPDFQAQRLLFFNDHVIRRVALVAANEAYKAVFEFLRVEQRGRGHHKKASNFVEETDEFLAKLPLDEAGLDNGPDPFNREAS